MGIGSWLKILGKGAAIAGAPFTGGASLAALPAIDAIGGAMSTGAQSMAHNRGVKGEMLLDQNNDLERQLLARETEKRAAQKQAYNGMMMGSRAQNWQPLKRPSGMTSNYQSPSEGSRVAGGALYNQSIARMGAPDLSTMEGNSGMPAYRNLANDKDFKGTMKSGIMEKLLGIGGVAAPILGGVFGPKGAPTEPNPYDK